MAQTAADRNYLRKIIRQEMYGTGPGQGGIMEGDDGQVVFSGTGANGGKYKIIQTSPTDFMIHANGKHIDTYSSLQRAMSVLKNEVPGLTKGVAEGSERSIYKQAYMDGYNGKSFNSPYKPGSDEDDEYDEGWHDGRLDYEKQDVAEGETWSKHNNKRAGGMSKKSVASYRRSHPGSKIQTAVTTKPSKLKKGSKAAKRRASFCARMRGMKKHRTGAKTANDPNSNINKSLRRWHCESIEELHELVMLAEQFIRNKKNEL
jgi:hypothetical protein